MPEYKYIDANHEYFMDDKRIPSTTEILTAAGLYDTRNFTEESRQRGQYVHKANLYYLQDDLSEDNILQEYKGYIAGFKRFTMETDFKPHIEQCEKPRFHEILRFGGTPDIPCLFNGKESLIDTKTGAETDTTGIQLTGYEVLLGYPVKRYGLYLRADGTYRLIPYIDRDDIKIFYSCLNLYHYRAERGLL